MKIVVDLDLCAAHGQCEDVAPEVFRVTDEALVEVLMTNPDESLRPKVEEAARLCPTDVIRIED